MAGWLRRRRYGRECGQDERVDLCSIEQRCFYCHQKSLLLPRSKSQDPGSRVHVLEEALKKTRGSGRAGREVRISYGVATDWQCTNCLAWTKRDKNGEILDYDPAMSSSEYNQAYFAQRTNGHRTTSPESSIFCQHCLANQNLVVHLLANYLPDEQDAAFERAQDGLQSYKASIIERYPLVCPDCQPAVDLAIRKANYNARTTALAKVIGKPNPGEGAVYHGQGVSLLTMLVCFGYDFTMATCALMSGDGAFQTACRYCNEPRSRLLHLGQVLAWLYCSWYSGRVSTMDGNRISSPWTVVLIMILKMVTLSSLARDHGARVRIRQACLFMVCVSWLQVMLNLAITSMQRKRRQRRQRDRRAPAAMTAPVARQVNLDDSNGDSNDLQVLHDPMDCDPIEPVKDRPSWPETLRQSFFPPEPPTGLESIFDQALSLSEGQQAAAVAAATAAAAAAAATAGQSGKDHLLWFRMLGRLIILGLCWLDFVSVKVDVTYALFGLCSIWAMLDATDVREAFPSLALVQGVMLTCHLIVLAVGKFGGLLAILCTDYRDSRVFTGLIAMVQVMLLAQEVVALKGVQ